MSWHQESVALHKQGTEQSSEQSGCSPLLGSMRSHKPNGQCGGQPHAWERLSTAPPLPHQAGGHSYVRAQHEGEAGQKCCRGMLSIACKHSRVRQGAIGADSQVLVSTGETLGAPKCSSAPAAPGGGAFLRAYTARR
jgi:hypothetical protein